MSNNKLDSLMFTNNLKQGDQFQVLIETPFGDVTHAAKVINHIDGGLPSEVKAFTFAIDEAPERVIIAMKSDLDTVWKVGDIPAYFAALDKD